VGATARDLAAACGGEIGGGAGAAFMDGASARGGALANGGAPARGGGLASRGGLAGGGGATTGGTFAGAAVSADSAGGCGLKTRGMTNRPASAAAANVPKIAGRHRARFAAGRGRAAKAAACSSTLRRIASLGRLGSRADARR